MPADRRPRRNRQSFPCAGRRGGWLRHPALLALALLATGTAPVAYLTAGGGHRQASLAPGDTVAVYGPRQFAGSNGNGTTYVERFTVALVPGRQYLLRLDNGATGGANRASSAVTTLNGYQVVSSSDLTSSIASVTKVVSVRQVDTLRIAVIGSAGSFVTATVSAAKTAEYAVNGPSDYGVPSGTSKTYSFSFTKPAGAGPPFRLYLSNGDSVGGHRVTNASVTLNGTTVVTTNEFTKSVGSLTKTVALAATNNVTIALKGSALTFATLGFTATDTAAPVVAITSPAAGAVTSTSPITVSGTISDQSPTGVTVNGVAATVTNNTSYSASVPLPTQGTNTLTVVATDAGGRSSQVTRTVVFDNQPPVLAVSAPVDGSATQAATVTVNATATDATALTLNTNGTLLTPGSGTSYSGSVALVAGANVLTTTATDAAGNATSVVRTVTRDNTPPTLAVTSPADGTMTSADSITVSGTVSDQTSVTVTASGVSLPVSGGAFSGKVELAPGPNTIAIAATDAAGNTTSASRSVEKAVTIPPDPATVATPIDPTVATTLAGSTAFLYTGPNRIQTGVAPGTIVATRVAVLRGRVLDRAGVALSGVRVSVLGHPELGQTVTRADGWYDLAVNGGGRLTLSYEVAGYLPLQRELDTPWQDYVNADDVMLSAPDARVDTVDFTAPVQVARASPVSDASGTRQATLLFKQGTQASMVLPDGSTQALPSAAVRATEYTVGTTGPAAMPGVLPPTSGYTYAVDLSVDAAIAARARQVDFTRPVPFYVENFLGLPVGTNVPAGYYDRQVAQWKPADDGRVIKLVSVTNGLANLVVDTTGATADNTRLAAFGIDDAERQQLASLYQPGQTLWRVPVVHFTPYDLNWAIGLALDAVGPPLKELFNGLDKPCHRPGSVIECENQVLGEEIGVGGTPWSLVYRSRRTEGYVAGRTLRIPLSGASVPASLKRILLEVNVAGRTFEQTFQKAPNLVHTFVWDGRDAYDRVLRGPQPVHLRVGYVYDAVYRGAAQSTRSFMLSSGAQLGSIPARQEYVAWAEERATLGTWDATAAGLGGWSLNVHHAFAPATQTLYEGDGSQRTVQAFAIRTIAGQPGVAGYTGDNGPATNATFSGLEMIAAGPDGSLYVTERGNCSVRKIVPGGVVTTFAGGRCGSGGDGGPATQAQLGWPQGVAVSPDGSVYVADFGVNRIRRVRPDGIIENFAGTGTYSSTGDGGAALSATLAGPQGLAIGPDGSVYVAEGYNVRRVTPDGRIYTVAGTGSCAGGGLGYGNLATKIQLCGPTGVAVGSDGTLYITQCCDVYSRVLRVGTDGILTKIAGGNGTGFSGDGGPATQAKVWRLGQVAVGNDGSVFVADWAIGRVRKIAPDGIITTVAGATLPDVTPGPRGDGGLATQAYLTDPRGVTAAPDGSLYIAGYYDAAVRKVAPSLPALGPGSFSIASEDGAEVYEFDGSGRHLRTRDALTGAVRLTFGYDPQGRLASITDPDTNVTTIARDASGRPTALVAPFGQRTALTLDPAGALAAVTNEAGERVRLYHSSAGLLDSLTTPRGDPYRFTYDALGRLVLDADPAGGSQALTRTEGDSGWTVQLATGLGRTTGYRVDQTAVGGLRRVITDPAGLVTTRTTGPDDKTITTFPDGSAVTLTTGPNPRFGAQAQSATGLTVATPGGLTATMAARRRTTLSTATDPLSLMSRIDSVSFNGQWTVGTYSQSTKQLVQTSPEGRQVFSRVDAKGRLVQTRTAGLDSVNYRYDARGRVDQVRSGGRVWTYGYDTRGRLATTLDPLGRRDSLFYDPADRLTRRVLPGGRTVQFAYDSSGNLIGLTPPSRPVHGFAYDPGDQATGYTPPSAGLTTPETRYSYNTDRQLARITRPDSGVIDVGYEGTTGRPSTVTFDRGQVALGYSPTTGQLTSLTAPGNNTLTFTYDGPLPKTVTWTGAVQGSVGLGYNNDLRVTSQTVNGASSLGFGYDRDGLLTTAGALGLKRHAQHGLVERDSLNTVKSVWSYTPRGALAGATTTSGATTLFQTAYTRDSLDRITSLTETIGGTASTKTFTYDAAGRLFEVRRDGVLTATYEYDPNGNRTRLTTPGGLVTGTSDDQDRLSQYGTTTYTYGSNGELQTTTEPGVGTTSYTYDALGNLTAATLPDGTALSYVIDGQNRRVGKRVNGLLVQGFLYQSQLAPVAELDGSQQVVSRFVYGTQVNVPDYMIKGGITYRLISDHLGSVRLVVNAADGTVAQRLDYDEFGRVTQNTAPGFQPFGFAGGLLDTHTGLTRFGARDFDPQIGRWTAKDPLGFGGGYSNLYEYVDNDPVNMIDPTGLQKTGTGRSPDDPLRDRPLPPGVDEQDLVWDPKAGGESGGGYWDTRTGELLIPRPEGPTNWDMWERHKWGRTRPSFYPQNSRKPRPGQKRFKPNQCPTDPWSNPQGDHPTQYEEFIDAYADVLEQIFRALPNLPTPLPPFPGPYGQPVW